MKGRRSFCLVTLLGVGFVLFFGGCRSTEDWTPRLDRSRDSTVFVEDFTDDGSGLGVELADQVAAELSKLGAFRAVSREARDSGGIVVAAEIQRYREGSVPARMKFGPAVGQASLKVEVSVFSGPDRELMGTFVVDESTLLTHPDAGRTGRETFTWLQAEVAQLIAKRLAGE